jgi:signal transduction histidine kinase
MPPADPPAQVRPGGALAGILRTTAFRVTLLHLALTLFGTAALSAVAWWATTGFAARQVAEEVARDMGVLQQAAQLGGMASAAVSVEARLAADRGGAEYYALTAPDGGRVAGNLAEAPRLPGWRNLRLEGGQAGPETTLLALGAALPGGGFLVVARDLAPVRELEARLLGAAGWVGGGALLLGLLGGAVMSRGVARRAAAMEAALAAVEAGEITRRLAAREGGDEFDRLAARINATLDRLAALMQAVRQVTDDIAHDLRTPLARLRQRLEAALRAAPGSTAEWEAAVEGALADCDRILGIFAALLRIAQVESGARRAGFTRLDLTAVAEAVAEVYAPATEARGQVLETRLAPGLMAWGDRELVTQMLANLVENAVTHGREAGHIQLTLEARPGGGALLAVADDGPGIPEAERERVLRRFHRLDTARSQPGSGLGLALVAAVAELHGMRLTLGDNRPGLRAVLEVPAPP